MKKNGSMWPLILLVSVPLLGTVNSTVAHEKHVKIDPEKIRAHLKYLASDTLEGRGTGQKGGDMAADYIAGQFNDIEIEIDFGVSGARRRR